jgi:hypothetical protein
MTGHQLYDIYKYVQFEIKIIFDPNKYALEGDPQTQYLFTSIA